MKVYLVDNKKITKFILPSAGDEFFSYNYMIPGTNTSCLINFEKKDGVWLLKGNGVVSVYKDNANVKSVSVTEYCNYSIKVIGYTGNINIYFLPYSEQLYRLDVSKVNNISIGNSNKCNIFYYNNNVAPNQIVINKSQNGWVLSSVEDARYSTYVDNYRVIRKKLEVGNIIFVNGLKIIWMNNFIIVNNPNNRVKVTGLTAYNVPINRNNTAFSPVSDEDKNVKLYSDEDYFYHTPRIQEVVEEDYILIESPPPSEVKEEMPWILTIGSSITMIAASFMMIWNVASGISRGQSNIVSSIPMIVMCIAMVIGGLIMPRFVSSYQKKKMKKREDFRVSKFSSYLDEKQKKIDLILKKEGQIMRDNSLSATNCKQVIFSKNNRNFWSREISDDDFLTVRLGLGSVDAPLQIDAPLERFTLDEDNLLTRALDIVEKSKKIDNVPVNISLQKHHISSFVCNDKIKDIYLTSIITQLIAQHSGAELKIVVFTNEINSQKWDFAKYLPHIWSDDKSVRFFATNLEEAKDISNTLEEVFKNRKSIVDGTNTQKAKITDQELLYKNFDTYYLVICDCYKNNLGIPIINDILSNSDLNLGFSFVIFSNTLKNLPAKCNTFVEVGPKDGCILERNISSKNQQVFTVEYDNDLNMRMISNYLLNIPLLTKEGAAILPQSLSFLEMYGVSKIEQLNILNRWKTNNPVTSLTAPVGVHASGELFKLNLHEKFDGPHGLIAGMTGSGKSEFIITYILSMCINYHPYEVQFVLIDYKGGGLAGAFHNKETGIKIPHLVGTITNLDTAEMNRTLVSIESELKRRQIIFNETKDQLGESTIDIYKYQRLYREGAVKEPLAHLFIISDEFAELKSQQPEFMQQLISTARIGRSLGVHLILATQKPSGVVNDQIWSNSKFKVCLKVQDRGDSMEMLKKPDAASIKEAGRFFLQVGYDDYFDKGQSGWAGAKYVPSDSMLTKIDDSVEFINNIGDVVRSIKDNINTATDTTNYGDQLTNIVKSIYEISLKENIHTNSLWLNSIPEIIYVEDLKKKYGYKPTSYIIKPLIGEYDKPSAQEQGPVNLDISGGNTAIWGQNGSGKEHLLSTIIWSTIIEHTPEEVNLYIIDCGAESLKMFNNMPHVGTVCEIEDGEKIFNTFIMVEEELQARKELMADYGGSYEEYIKNSGKKLPLLVVIINNYESFGESYARLSESIQSLYRDGFKYGIVFIVSAIGTNTIRPRMLQNFKNKLCLQVPNPSEYRNLLNAPRGLTPSKYFGRGLIELGEDILEFQSAYFCEKKDMVAVVRATAKKFNEAYKFRAKPIIVVPDIVTSDILLEQVKTISEMPIGISMTTKEPLLYNFEEHKVTPILAAKFGGEKLAFVKVLIDYFHTLKDVKVNILDLTQTFEGVFKENYYSNNFEEAFANINNYIINNKESNVKNVNFIIGVGLLKSKLNDQGLAIVNNIFNRLPAIDNTYFIFVDSSSSYKNLQTEIWYQSNINNSSGIWLGEEVANQTIIGINNLSIEDRNNNFLYMGFAINNGKHEIFKHVVENRGE